MIAMLSAGLLESPSDICRCGHPRSAHDKACHAGHENELHLIAEARRAARKHGLDSVRLAVAVLNRKGRPCPCRRFK